MSDDAAMIRWKLNMLADCALTPDLYCNDCGLQLGLLTMRLDTGCSHNNMTQVLRPLFPDLKAIANTL